MNIYWSLRGVPELAQLSRRERRRVHHACLQRHFFDAVFSWHAALALFGGIICGVLLAEIGRWLSIGLGVGETVARCVEAAFATAGFLFAFRQAAVLHLRPFYASCAQEHRKDPVQPTAPHEPPPSVAAGSSTVREGGGR